MKYNLNKLRLFISFEKSIEKIEEKKAVFCFGAKIVIIDSKN